MLVDDSRPSDLLQVAAEIIFRSHCFDNLAICAIAPGGQELRGRIGLGPQADALKKHLRIPLGFTPDVFHAAISKGADLVIQDATAENIRERIPAGTASTSAPTPSCCCPSLPATARSA
jgi:hypothetical protein